jgi:thiol:disulfide interchange protein DsbD
MPPHDVDIDIVLGKSAVKSDIKSDATLVPDRGQKSNQSTSVVATINAQVPTQSLWSFILEAILWGFAALLTPCVFPMVPMTVSYFLKSNTSAARGRFNAGLYGFFIVALYTLPVAGIILITRWLGGDSVTADIFNFLATHWIPNVLFFMVFMVFAASFFGAFEITMPSRLVNRTDQQSEKGGVLGIFFMSLTLVLVSFSCTGPIVGSVLIKSTSGEFLAPIVTMFAFSAAFAVPFTLFAFFPSMLKNLPKSGGWLNAVKVVLGFIEVALGMKFLSVADQTYHWGILDREVYLAIWIVVFFLLGLYLLGKIKFAHDSEMKFLSVPRLGLAIVVFSFVVYMIPGMWGAPLKALSGYLPPLSSQDFTMNSGSESDESQNNLKTKYSDFLHLPHDLVGFFDYTEALAYAKQVHKPVFIDFTGHGCVNCREMEAKVWSDPRVLKLKEKEKTQH